MNLQLLLQVAVSGALAGGLFALMAMGLSLTWGMLRVINLAHFVMILLGAYLAYELSTAASIDPLLTLIVTVPVMFGAGAAIQWLFQASRISEFNSLLVSFGILIVVVQLITNYWTADFRQLEANLNPYVRQSLRLGELVLPLHHLLGFGFATGISVGGYLILERTVIGRALRAFAQDPAIAAAFGIDHNRLALLLAGAAGGTAAVAGTLWAIGNPLTPAQGFEWIGVVFAIVIIGGIGNVLGTLVAGALVLALYSVVSLVWSPSVAPLVVFSAIVVTLVLRPQGLFSRRGS
ncbi:MAG TPA: branched-chain amino acid ABC transporter permease [Candidatus Limnocylindria bacterium]|nr:branched-chain amino acid ABC transporter permease [Candidatus Limnocylindria bacterium]